MEKGMRINGERWYIYIETGVMGGGGKWYLRCFRCGVVSLDFFFIGGVRLVMCIGRSVRVCVCSHAYILKGFQIFFIY